MATISGGANLTAYLKKLSEKVSKAALLRVGFLEGSTYPDGTSTPMIAAIQNFGSGRIPPRPFFSNMVRDKSPGWGDSLGRILEANDYDAAKSLALMGLGIEGQLKQSILDTNAPPLSPITIAKKGFDKPLIETSHMINSVASEVKA